MCKKCKNKKDKENKKERYTFMSGGIYGESRVIDNKTGKEYSTLNFLLR